MIFGVEVIGSNQFVADTTLVRVWSQEYYNQHPFQPFPKVVKFYSGKTMLVFVATKHADWEKSQLSIKTAIEKDNPDIILIEGIQKKWGISPQLSDWDKMIQRGLNSKGREVYFAYQLAHA